jgi:chaperone required for assembly of F1-ATPase
MNEICPTPAPRRFYDEVAAVPATDGRFEIRLDGRSALTPGGAPLAAPTAALGRLLASEWVGQGATIAPATMPATRLAGAILDGGESARTRATEAIADYASSDLICYFAPFPRALAERQAAVWGPLLDWAKAARGLAFVRAVGIVHQPQPRDTLERLRGLLAELDDFTLAGLAQAASLFGSAILALALRDQRLDVAAALAAARLDETFQEAQWGADPENARRSAIMAREADGLARWFDALR